MKQETTQKLNIQYVPIESLRPSEYNPRVWSKEAISNLRQSITRHGMVDPLLVNSAQERKGVVIGGHFRLSIMKELGYKETPVIFLNIPDIKKEQELNIRLNKNTGEFDLDLLTGFEEAFLADIGFSSEDIDKIFPVEETPEVFDLQKELQKLNITKIEVQKGDVWQLGQHKLKCGDSTVETDVLDLMDGEKASMCLTDPPYLLNSIF